jgi:ribosome-associated protein
MPDDAWLLAGKFLRIPRAEVSYRATRAGGPGGQHVNKSATRIELWWNLRDSTAVTPEQRGHLVERLGHRLDGEGWIRLVEAGNRSQHRNREVVTIRFLRLLEHALKPRKVRRPTGIPRVEKRKRLESKRQRAAVKRLRGKVQGDE